MTKGDLARQNFKSGYNCSQAVALAFQDKIGMDPDTIARLTIGFGGGMGRMREVCGTISGVTFVLSALYGDRPKSEVYAMVQQVAKGFQAETGSLVCRVLLGLDPNVKPTPPGGTPHRGLLQKASLRRIMRPGRRPFRRLFKKYHLKGLHFAMRCAILFEQKRSSAFAYALVAQLDRVSGYEPEGRGFESLPAYQ